MKPRWPWLLLVAWLWATGSTAWAHEFRPATLLLRAHEGGEVTVRFVPPPVTARGPTSAALRPVPPEHCEAVSSHRWSCGSQGLTGTVAMAGLGSDPVDVLVHVRWPDDTELRTRLDPRTPSIVLPRGAVVQGPGSAIATYLAIGGEHILGGWDHLLFLAALLLLGGSALDHLRTITAFTLGHGVTLLLQMLHPVQVPGPWVEACIAASIAITAVSAQARHPPRATAWTWALGFGVVHGLGFAGALARIGLPPAHRLPALLGFNLGVEAGQLAVVLSMLAIVAAVPGAPATRQRLRRGLAFAVGSIAVALTFERVVAFWSTVP